jgi:folate-dependent phosphoribosylglycinamide formyltransferase PurN
LLAGRGRSTNILYHALARTLPDLEVVIEAPVPRGEFLRKRVRRLGYGTVAGQVLFEAFVRGFLAPRSRKRITSILRDAGLDDSPIPEAAVREVRSVNSPEARTVLTRLDPAVVVVNGTRIISIATLKCVDTPFINMHAGITPQYRGVHGGYWALVEGRPDLVGTTVHFVDPGIDTGAVIAQATFDVEPEDSFVSYPYLHIAAGIDALVGAVQQALRGERSQSPPLWPDGPSVLRTHPTLWQYFKGRTRGVA